MFALGSDREGDNQFIVYGEASSNEHLNLLTKNGANVYIRNNVLCRTLLAA